MTTEEIARKLPQAVSQAAIQFSAARGPGKMGHLMQEYARIRETEGHQAARQFLRQAVQAEREAARAKA